MARHMFRDVVDPSIHVGSTRGYTVPLSIAAHALVIAALIVIPLVAIGRLPSPPTTISFISVGPDPLPPPTAPARTTRTTATASTSNPDAAPLEAPRDISPEPGVEPREQSAGVVEQRVADVPGGFFANAGPPPPPVQTAGPQAPIRQGGNIRPPTRIKEAAPVYPSIAQAARVQGVVIIEATIGVTGRVQDAKILRSIPLLDAAALDAVRQWEYAPTLLNGMPVAVIITVTVNFRLR